MKKFTVISDDDIWDELFISKFLERNKNKYSLNNILISSDKIEQFKKRIMIIFFFERFAETL